MAEPSTPDAVAEQPSAGPAEPPPAEPPAEELRVVPVRHPGRWVAVAVLAVLAAMLVNSLIRNPAWEWDYVRGYFTYGAVLRGIVVTLELTVLAMVLGLALGVVVAIMRLSPNPIVSGAAWVYTWFFRGTPVLVQLIFWGYISALYPRLGIGVPFGPHISGASNALISTFTAAVLGLGLNEAAYMSEIVRAGLLSVDHGQTEAAQALGMRRMLILRRIVLPQAMRVIIPPTGNETISMLKTTSLVTVLALGDLLGTVSLIYGSNFKYIPLLAVASIWYLTMTSILSIGQYYVERYYARGASRALPPTPLQRLRAWVNLFAQARQASKERDAAEAEAGGDDPDGGGEAGAVAGGSGEAR
jgi:polar amino acid transport system permease protein